MSDQTNTSVAGRRSRWLVWSIIALSVLTLSAICAFFYKVQLVNIDSSMPWSSDAVKAQYFNQHFATTGEIEERLDDATIVFSKDVGDVNRGLHSWVNEIYYISGHGIINWGNTDVTTELAHGEWGITPKTQILYRKGRFRLVENHVFCIAMFSGPSPGSPVCSAAPDVRHLGILSFPGITEYRKGDVFSLRNADKPPFLLNTKRPISFVTLLKSIQDPIDR